MDTLLEQQRSYHEERERIVQELTRERLHKCTTHRETVNSEHRQRQLLDRYNEITLLLKDIYEDKDGLRKEEIATLSGPNEFAEFYSRFKGIKEFYKKHPDEICAPMSEDFKKYEQARTNPNEEAQNMADFTAEEGYGKYLDLHEIYNKYINLKSMEKLDYVTYLSVFDHLFDIPKEKKGPEYRKYLQALLEYLWDFCGRVHPLLDLDEEMVDTQREFDIKWETGTFPGWPKEATSAMAHSGAHLDLSAFSSWEELASLGLDRLKSALMALGLKCGGTLEERAQRLFETKGKRLEEMEAKLFAKAKPGKSGRGREQEKNKDTGAVEAYIYRVMEHLMEQKHATKENVTRKQARTAGEEEDEDEEVAVANESDDEEDTDVPYNPKNLPLDWDGKPIPYWLYKLHGLNIDYTCEICGDHKYRGPKAFQRHFSESWRHAHGMRCLGIPNTAHFANVTSIEGAVALWRRLKDRNEKKEWKAEQEEEYEDSQGNVVNKKTYEDLKRQGLL